MEGRDVTGQAQTGTGKTAAFVIPILEKIDARNREVQALVLCPTRELAQQITEAVVKLSAHIPDLGVEAVYGGTHMMTQVRKLEKGGVQLIVGTPGRVLDHLRRRTVRFFQVRMVTLDEADEMLDMGFREDIDEIISYTSSKRQTLLFSATMPKEILDLTQQYQKDPLFVTIENQALVVPAIEQSYVETTEGNKNAELADLIRKHRAGQSLVFCNTKRQVNQIASYLRRKGFNVEGLHGDMEQYVRDGIMNRFRANTLRVLVATDIAARGIDVTNVDLVVNYDVPKNADHYVHRIGRTGRAGKTGSAVTLVLGRDQKQLKRIEKHTKHTMVKLPAGSVEVKKPQTDRHPAPEAAYAAAKAEPTATKPAPAAKPAPEAQAIPQDGEQKPRRRRRHRGGRRKPTAERATQQQEAIKDQE